MALFEHFPYTNFHEMNLDWLVQRVNKLEEHPTIVNEGYVILTIDRTNPMDLKADKTAAELSGAIVNSIPIIVKWDANGYRLPRACSVTGGKVKITLPDEMHYDEEDMEYQLIYDWYFEIDENSVVENIERIALATA